MAAERDVWTVAEAKARLSDLLERAVRVGPQRVTRHGRPHAVVVSASDWRGGGGRRSTLDVLLKTCEPFSPGDDSIERLFPRLATPRLAAPRLAAPRLAAPRVATMRRDAGAR